MYSLTLTRQERAAIDWVGHRYRHGDELSDLLMCLIEDDDEWDGDDDITFEIPEHVAWQISDIIDEGLDCFGDELASKLWTFRDSIV